MKLCLFYNEKAGEGVSLEKVRGLLEAEGHEVVQVVETKSGNGCSLQSLDAVVVAGGDGTVAKAAKAVAGRGIPIAILPFGTANNIAKSLGIAGTIEEIVKRWNRADLRRFDVGVARGSWGERRFLEAVGGGVIPRTISVMDNSHPEDTSSNRRYELKAATLTCRDVLMRQEGIRWKVTCDGVPLSEELLLLEVMNIGSIGPNLELSQKVDSSDGLLSVVFAAEPHRRELAEYLQNRTDGKPTRLSLPTVLARHIEIEGAGDIHLDDEVFPGAAQEALSIRVEAGALQFLA